MLAEDLLREGRLDEALKSLQESVRSRPSDAALRIFLFQLLALMGQWERALNQLNVAGELDAGALAMVQMYRTALNCEALRGDVFAGRLTPMVLGKPGEWIAPLIQALHEDAEGNHDLALSLRNKAFELAPSVSGRYNEQSFSWFGDADPRLGPVLEVIVNGRYAWLPMENIQELRVEKPSDLRDLVWLPANIKLINAGELVALIPSRYPSSETSTDGAIRMARKTDWFETGVPVGQRMFASDSGDVALFELKMLRFDHPAAESAHE